MDGRLTNRQFLQISEAISGPNMESIAQGYMDLDLDTIASIRHDNQWRVGASNKAILRAWASLPGNQGRNQKKKLARLLLQAAQDGAYVNPYKVEEILGYNEEQTGHDELDPDLVPVPDVIRVCPELTMPMLLQISRRINNEYELYTLATIGLRMDENTIEQRIITAGDIHSATFNVLKDWRRNQCDLQTAYNNMCIALRHEDVNMASYLEGA